MSLFKIILIHLLFVLFLFNTSCTSKVNEIESLNQKSDSEQITETKKDVFCEGDGCKVCPLPWGGFLNHGKTLSTSYSKEIIECSEECDQFQVALYCDAGKLVYDQDRKKEAVGLKLFNQCTKKKCACSSDGVTVPDGAEYIFYKNSVRVCDQKCEGKSLKCVSGNLVDATTPTSKIDLKSSYPSKKCDLLPCQSCTAPVGVIDHNVTLKAYKSGTLTCGGNCETTNNTANLKCYNGVITGGIAADFGNKTCSVSACQSCLLPCGKNLAHGESGFCHSSAQASVCGSSGCDSSKKVFTCDNGTIKDQSNAFVSAEVLNQFKQSSCELKVCKNCNSSWGTEYVNGSNFIAFKSSKVACGQSCSSVANILNCNDGVISGPELTSTIYGSCVADACKTCKLPCGKEVLTGGFDYCYKKSEPSTCGESCSDFQKYFGCQDGKLIDEKKIQIPDLVAADYKEVACTQKNICSQCILASGKKVDDGKLMYFYKNSKVTCKSSCTDPANMVALKCSDGDFLNKGLYKDFVYESCVSECSGFAEGDKGIGRLDGEGGGAPQQMCLMPWGKQLVANNTQFVAFSKGSVPKGDKCSNYKKIIKCNGYRGTWSGGIKYIYPTCYEEK